MRASSEFCDDAGDSSATPSQGPEQVRLTRCVGDNKGAVGEDNSCF
jgi:hypothetical protein